MPDDIALIERIANPNDPIGALAIAVVLILIGLVLSWIVRRIISAALRHDRSELIDQITLSFLSRLAVLIIWILLATLYAHLIPVLHRVATAMLAGVGLVSVVIGFAAQTTLGNLIAGIGLVIYKPFRRGDRLQVFAPTKEECEVGSVQDISLGYTRLLTDDGREIIVANGTIAQQTMIRLKQPTIGEPNS